MESNKEITFLEIMNCGLIRKKIIEKLSYINDIKNLAETCQELNSHLFRDKITMKIYFFQDLQNINVRNIYGTIENPNVIMFEDMLFEKHSRCYAEFEIVKNLTCEILFKKHCINIYYSNWVEHFFKSEHKLLVEKLWNDMKIECEIRKNMTILEFLIDFSYHHYLVLYVLCQVEHSNITRIRIPDSTFMASDSNVYKKLTSNIFGGFEKFHELEINCLYFQYNFRRLIKNKFTIENILKELSKKKNATLILTFLRCDYINITKLIKMILEITSKYNINLKCNVKNIVKLNSETNNTIRSKNICISIPIKEYITTITFSILNSKIFLSIMKNLQHLTNLEALELEFLFYDIRKNLKYSNILNGNEFNIKNCNRLERIKLYFAEFINRDNNVNVEKFCNNFKYLVSLMPKTIIRFELIKIPIITKEVATVINKYMSNIKILVIDNVIFKEPDSLIPFNNLQTLICYEFYPIQIPPKVELIAIKLRHFKYIGKELPMNKELIQNYSGRLTKTLLDTKNGRYIFFNDIKKWISYKHVIEELFW